MLLSGSLPQGVSSSTYAQLVTAAKNAGRLVFLDTSGDALSHALSASPSLIKPNRQEAEALLDRKVSTVQDAVCAAGELRRLGPDTVILSLGSDGAVLVNERVVLQAVPPSIKAASSVGSGDSFLAGWAVAGLRGFADEEALRRAVSCGAANCLAASPGCISPDVVEQISREVQLRRCPF